MSGYLESQWPGRIFIGFGVGCLAAAVGLAAWDVSIGNWAILPVNLITLASGLLCIYTGRINLRNAARHHKFMDEHRRRIAELDQWARRYLS